MNAAEPKSFNPLQNVADGLSGADIGAYDFWRAAPWLALYLGIQMIHGGKFLLFVFAALAFGAWGVFKKIPDAPAASEPGVWMTSRLGLWRGWIARSGPLTGAGLSALVALVAGLKNGSAWAVAYLLALCGVFAIQAVVSFWSGRAMLVREIELRIDDTGLYSRGLNGTLGWEEILEIAPRQRGDQGLLRLVVGPNTTTGLSTERQMRGGPITVNLTDASASREAVVTAMIVARPSLDPQAKSSNAFVLPIEGVFVDQPPATDGDVAVPLVASLALGVMISS
jgi:hypothetical protein